MKDWEMSDDTIQEFVSKLVKSIQHERPVHGEVREFATDAVVRIADYIIGGASLYNTSQLYGLLKRCGEVSKWMDEQRGK